MLVYYLFHNGNYETQQTFTVTLACLYLEKRNDSNKRQERYVSGLQAFAQRGEKEERQQHKPKLAGTCQEDILVLGISGLVVFLEFQVLFV